MDVSALIIQEGDNTMSRRANGEGSIYRRSDGRWCAGITLPDGKRKYLYGETRKEVAEKLNQLKHNVQQGLPVRTYANEVSGFATSVPDQVE